ncbi:MAG: delta-class carbonic anhydrase [Bdellovibrionales bacterium]
MCAIFTTKQAEHKGPEFSVHAGPGEGYQCNATDQLTPDQLAAPAFQGCENINPGDTIEVHWVHTSCDVEPGPGLGILPI